MPMGIFNTDMGKIFTAGTLSTAIHMKTMWMLCG